ncbi:DUF3606 domain-containing protein [Variovorax sp.]|uniref:DUF3606 domain-containing protein n=1 Tax=Variovorax sp. TaxID=1871043 RepID=UPI002D42006F|nr:DUF3606 domain-containing protein [Variovorax sp.]HYP83245.1 DUF3606 domain-containing protein [Variovorax sp.]
MKEDPNRAALDSRQLIAVDQVNSVSSWSRSIGCTPEQLRLAVKEVGRSADAVRRYLKARR